MKKKALIMAIVAMVGTLLFSLPANADVSTPSYFKMVELIIGDKEAAVNGDFVTMDQAAYVKNDRTLVPFRFLAEALGAQVTWDDKTNTAGLNLKGSEVKVTIGSKIAYVNTKTTTLDVPAETKGGRTFIPLRFVSEALGAKVDYDADLELVTVTLIDTAGWNHFKDPNGGNLIYPKDWKLSGDTNSVLTLESPQGTKIAVKSVEGTVTKIVEEQKAAYDALDFLNIMEEPIDTAQPEKGTSLGFVKLDLNNTENTEAVAVVVSKEEDGTYLYKIESNVTDMPIDAEMMDKIFLSEQDFEQWQSKQP